MSNITESGVSVGSKGKRIHVQSLSDFSAFQDQEYRNTLKLFQESLVPIDTQSIDPDHPEYIRTISYLRFGLLATNQLYQIFLREQNGNQYWDIYEE